MSVTIPTNDWNFLVSGAVGDIIYDNISSNTATYESSFTSDATNGAASNSNTARLRIGTGSLSFHSSFSFEMLVRMNSSQNYHQLFYSHSGAGKNGTGLYYGSSTGGKLGFFLSTTSLASEFYSTNTGTYTGSALTMDGSTFYHIVCVCDGTNNSAYIYLDGTKIWENTSLSLSESDFPITPSTYVAIGREQNTTNINIKTFRVWENHALSAVEITTLYNNRNTANYISTIITPALPKYSWNFLTTGAANSTHLDSISNVTATYGSNVSSTTTDGILINGGGGAGVDDVTLPNNLSFSSSYSFEFYIRLNANNNYGGIFSFRYSGNHEIVLDMYGTTRKLRYYMWSGGSVLFGSHGADGIHNGTLMTTDGTTYHHIVCNYNSSTQIAEYYQDGTRVWYQTGISIDESNFPIVASNISAIGDINLDPNMNMKYFRIWTNHALNASEVQSLYNNRNTNLFSFTNLRITYGDVYLAQNLNKTLADYKAANIPLNDVSFAAFPINKFKETYILGDVDISGDTILRSNTTYFTDISADTFDVSGNLLISDLSANNRLFVDGDVSFNSNVTIQGDLSFGGDISFNGTFTRAQAGIGTGSGLLMNTDFSMNATLEFNGATTIKNDLHFNAYSDVSANPVLTDGTLLHNQKMEKLDHRYLLDISRSSPFSTLNYNTLPSNIYDNSTNSGICISGDGKYIRTVNSSDVSANALSYYSEDYGSSFQVDYELSNKLSLFDVSMNSLDDYHAEITSGEFRPIFGSDKVFMSYNGQHQLVPKGISNKLTFDDFLYVSNNFGKNWNLRKNNTISNTTYTYTVTANGSSNYILNGGSFSSEAQPAVSIYLNESTEFTIDSTTNGNHPFKIGTSENGGEITDSRITSVTSGSNQVVTFKPTTSGTFYYYCSSHSGMGSSINVIEPAGRFSLDASGSTWFWNTGAVSADGKHMYVSGKTGLWKSQDFGTSWYQASADSSFNYMSISADGKQVYGVNERKVYGSSDHGNTFSTLYTDSSTTDLNYAGISTSGNGKYLTIADVSGFNIYMSSNYGNSFELTPSEQPGGHLDTAIYNWDFRVAETSSITDSIGGITATYTSGATSTVADGLYLSGSGTSDGNSPYVNLQGFNTGGGMSFEVYMKFNSSGNYARILDFGVSNGSGANNLLLCRFGTSSQLYWGINSDGIQVTTGSTITNGVLTHIVGIMSTSGVLTLYQDGSLCGTGSTTKYTVQSRTNMWIGRSNWGSDAALAGNIHYVRVYDSELSSSDVTELYTKRENVPITTVRTNINCGISHSGKIVLNSNFISYDYGKNFHYIPYLISNQLTNNDTFYSKANMEYLLDPNNNLMLSIPYKSSQFQDIYSVGSIKVGSTTYSSDYRIKENVEDLGEEDTVNELRPVEFYNTNLKRDDYGLIAHELQEKYPFLVSGEKDGPEPQSINYNGLISLLVHEVKNLKKEYLELKEMKK